MRARSPKAVTRLALSRSLSKWVCESPCLKCGRNAVHAHHVLTRGAWITLLLCWLNIVPLCAECHAYAHANVAAFKAWLESLKPGLIDYLKSASRGFWSKPDLDIVRQDVEHVSNRPWHERWAEVEVA